MHARRNHSGVATDCFPTVDNVLVPDSKLLRQSAILSWIAIRKPCEDLPNRKSRATGSLDCWQRQCWAIRHNFGEGIQNQNPNFVFQKLGHRIDRSSRRPASEDDRRSRNSNVPFLGLHASLVKARKTGCPCGTNIEACGGGGRIVFVNDLEICVGYLFQSR